MRRKILSLLTAGGFALSLSACTIPKNPQNDDVLPEPNYTSEEQEPEEDVIVDDEQPAEVDTPAVDTPPETNESEEPPTEDPSTSESPSEEPEE